MAYTKVKVGSSEGYFLIDFATTASTIDTNNFLNTKPRPVANNTNRFGDFDFFGSWGTVTLSIQNHGNIQDLNLKQAGILGTDFLAQNAFLLDYKSLTVSRANKNTICNDNLLLHEGFKAASTAGYYTNNTQRLNNNCTPNIPTVPVKIGNASAVAQIDPGYDDNRFRHSLNINQAFFKAIKASGIQLIENPAANLVLSTCTSGFQEKVKAYKLPSNVSFTVTGLDGNPIIIRSDVNLFLKDTPTEARACGGIGTWTIPAAQMGASFLVDAKKVIFDPFNEKVWFYTR